MSAPAFAPTRHRLPNGLTLLHQCNPVSTAVTISLSFAAGSTLEPAGREGLASLMARGLTRGTERHDKAAIGEILDDRGAHLAGTAGRHTAGLVAKARDVDFEALLDLAIECARLANFPDEEVRKMIGDRVTSLREDDDDPATVVGKVIRELIYPEGHPYGRRHRGTVESAQAVGADDLRSFRERHLRPEHGALIVVGGVESARALEAATRSCEGWGGSPDGPAGLRAAIGEVPDAPPLPETVSRTVRIRDKSQSDIALGFPSIRRTDERFHAATLMNSILGQFAMGGRLGRSVREEQGMAYYTYSRLDPSVGPGPLLVRAGVAPDHVERAVESIRTELDTIRREPVASSELEDARSATVRSLPRTLESNEGMAGLLHRIELFDLGLDYLDRFAERFERVTIDDVREAARELLHPDRYGLAVAGPGADDRDGSAA